MGNSAVIVNVRVVPAGSGKLAPFARYLGLREGAMKEQTGDDLRMRREVDLREMAGYYGQRPGALTEDGSALFDRDGALSVAEARRRFEGITSSAVMMTISVRNEDASLFGLEKKQDWERLARSNVERYIAPTGTIAPQDIEYACAAHVNAKSHHVHVVAWDASGTWKGRMLPKARMVTANDALRDQVTAPVIQRLSMQRTAARDELVRALASGYGVDNELLSKARSLLPAQGRISYEHLRKEHPDAAAGIRVLTEEALSANTYLSEVRDIYLLSARDQGRAKGLRGDKLDRHVSAAEADLVKRCSNTLIRATKQIQTENLHQVQIAMPSAETLHGGQETLAQDCPEHAPLEPTFTPFLPRIPVVPAVGGEGKPQQNKKKRPRRYAPQL